MKKVSLGALNEFLAQQLSTIWAVGGADIYESDSIERATERVIGPVPSEFWEVEWTNVRVQDNANTRSVIRQDLKTAQTNVRLKKAWYTKLQLVDSDTFT